MHYFINIINEASFPASVLSSWEIINLSENSFYCVCDQMWFVNWLRRTNVTLKRGPYICAQPQELMGTKLKNYKPTIESCTPWNPLFTVAITSTSHWHHSLFVKAFEIITTTFHEFCRKWSTFPLIVSPTSKSLWWIQNLNPSTYWSITNIWTVNTFSNWWQ
jgi:hypothetical protein